MLRPSPIPSRLAKRLILCLLLSVLCGSQWLSVSAKPPPPCETEAGKIVRSTVPSFVYGRPIPVSVYLPPCYADEWSSVFPVIYLLHGGGADETQWPDLNVQVSADALIGHGRPPFVVIMPGGAYSDPLDYDAFVMKDLIPAVQSQYRVQGFRAGRVIGGLSLGGYWALRIAFLHPDRFAAVGGYSPVTNLGYPQDPLSLARHADVETFYGLHIALDVGDKDSLAYDTKQIAQVLGARGITVSLTIGRGGHFREYWRAHTYEYFRYFSDISALSQDATPPQ